MISDARDNCLGSNLGSGSLENSDSAASKSDFNWNVHLYSCNQNKLLDSINGEGTLEILAKASA